MNAKVPIGERENARLEFKSSATKAGDVARGVVGMLNAEGGEIWIGVAEDNVPGIAARVENVKDAASTVRNLRNHLVDTIEPSPTHAEVSIDILPWGGGEVLLLHVTPDASRRPYAQIVERGRRYWIRVGDRLRQMDRQEVGNAFAEGRKGETVTDQDVARARATVVQRMQDLGNEPQLWMRVQPSVDLALQLDKEVGARLADPKTTGNRFAGWSFCGTNMDIQPFSGGIVLARGTWRTRIEARGPIEFAEPLEGHYGAADLEINPIALIELPTSIFRLASHLYRSANPEPRCRVIVGLALAGIGGWRLRPFSPGTAGHDFEMPGYEWKRFEEGRDLVIDPPMEFSLSEVVEEPDRCSLRVIKHVYAAFGYWEDAIPRQFDQQTGKLRFD